MSYMDFSSLSHGEVELTTHVIETAFDTWTIKKPRHISPKLVVLRALVHLVNLQAFALLINSEVVAKDYLNHTEDGHSSDICDREFDAQVGELM